MKVDKVYRLLASTVDARLRCAATMERYRKESKVPATARPSALCYSNDGSEWFDKHTDTIQQLVRDFLPTGSGWDSGTRIDLEHSTGEKLVLYGSYHHMDENGYYGGWTNHVITVRPSLIHGISLSISGRNRNDIKDYLDEMFSTALTSTCYWNDETKEYQQSEPKA